MQTICSDADDCQIETMTVARAYSRRHDLVLAGLTLFDSPDIQGHASRVEFHSQTLRVGADHVRYHVNLVTPTGSRRESVLPHDAPVFFAAPRFVPLSQDEWRSGPPPEKIALLRCLLTSTSLFQWTGRWVEQRVAEVEHEVSNGILEPELLHELAVLAASETVKLPARTRAHSSDGQRVAHLALLNMVGLADEREDEALTSWQITEKGRAFLANCHKKA